MLSRPISALLLGLTTLSACESHVRIEVHGLAESPVTVEVMETDTVVAGPPRRLTITTDGAREVGARGTVTVRVVDQPDQRPQSCSPAAVEVHLGGRVRIDCVDVSVCDGLLSASASDLTLEPVLEDLDLDGRSLMEVQARAGWYYLTIREGVVARVPTNGGTAQMERLLDISDRVEFGYDDGLLSVALTPVTESPPSLFVLYVSNATPRTVRLSRFEVIAEASMSFDSASELLLLEQPKIEGTDSHSGGTVRFGPDGLLYASLGDGGYVEPPSRNAQDSTLR